jgi:hypothetical protein
MSGFQLQTNTITPSLRDKLARLQRPRSVFEAGAKTVQVELKKHLQRCREDFKVRKFCAIKVRRACAIKTRTSQKPGQWSSTRGLVVGFGAWRR